MHDSPQLQLSPSILQYPLSAHVAVPAPLVGVQVPDVSVGKLAHWVVLQRQFRSSCEQHVPDGGAAQLSTASKIPGDGTFFRSALQLQLPIEAESLPTYFTQ